MPIVETKESTWNWGMVGTGQIVRKFLIGLKAAPGARAYAVASRSLMRAQEFAAEQGIGKAYGSYEDLAEDREVDIVYIGTPNHVHEEEVRLFLEHGKAVLCEKPFTMSVRATERLIALAREKKLFLMEAMWTKFLPVMKQVREEMKNGAIGEVWQLDASFGFYTERMEEHRVYRKSYGGGALFDVGVYPLALAQFLFGRYPERIRACGMIGRTGVDEVDTVFCSYPEEREEGGVLASLHCAIRAHQGCDAWIYGTEGKIFLPQFYQAEEAVFYDRAGNEIRRIRVPHPANGYEYEAEEVMRCVKEGRTESEGHSWHDMLELAKMTEEARAQIYAETEQSAPQGVETEAIEPLQAERKEAARSCGTMRLSWQGILEELAALIEGETDRIAALSNASALLMERLPRLNWAGFYRMGEGELVLGPFQGRPACVRIPEGKGVCGSAVLRDETVRVPDVHAFPGHIACDCASRSEIVIPIHVGSSIAGVLDLDSPAPERFTAEDQEGLEDFVRILEKNCIWP